jgi:phosphate/sulfate permease
LVFPSSSSHTLIGGFAGAGIAHAGTFTAVEADPIIKTASFYFPCAAGWDGCCIYHLFVVYSCVSKRYLAEIAFHRSHRFRNRFSILQP